MKFRHALRKILWKLGYDILPFRPDTSPLARRKQLIDQYGIDLVLDVGANKGQYARELRDDLGFRGEIVSFEPVQEAFRTLESSAGADPLWTAVNWALGDVDGTQEINVSANSYSSSMLNMLPAHLKSAPTSNYVRREKIETRKLDSVFGSFCNPGRKIYLKMDVQGFEARVIKGAEECLRHIDTIQLEMPLTPMYEDELSFGALHEILLGKGYQLVSLEPGFADRSTGQLLQVDGIYRREP